MHRIDADANVNGQFSEGDPTTGRPGTEVDAAWLNAVQEEICNAITDAGGVLDKASNDQLSAAMQARVTAEAAGRANGDAATLGAANAHADAGDAATLASAESYANTARSAGTPGGLIAWARCQVAAGGVVTVLASSNIIAAACSWLGNALSLNLAGIPQLGHAIPNVQAVTVTPMVDGVIQAAMYYSTFAAAAAQVNKYDMTGAPMNLVVGEVFSIAIFG